jgi:energy-coupling factor transport system permease protein
MQFELYAKSETAIHRLDARARLLVLLLMFIVPLEFEHPFPLACFFAFSISMAYLSRSLRVIRFAWPFMLLIASFSILTWSFLAHGETPFIFGASREAALYGLGSALKINAILLAGLVLLATTSPEEIVQSVTSLGVPYRLTFVFVVALRLVPQFFENVSRVIEAQEARGLKVAKGGLVRRARRFLPLLLPLFLMSLRKAHSLSIALESRGFGAGPRTFLVPLAFRAADYAVILASVLAAIFLTDLRLMGCGVVHGLRLM